MAETEPKIRNIWSLQRRQEKKGEAYICQVVHLSEIAANI